MLSLTEARYQFSFLKVHLCIRTGAGLTQPERVQPIALNKVTHLRRSINISCSQRRDRAKRVADVLGALDDCKCDVSGEERLRAQGSPIESNLRTWMSAPKSKPAMFTPCHHLSASTKAPMGPREGLGHTANCDLANTAAAWLRNNNEDFMFLVPLVEFLW